MDELFEQFMIEGRELIAQGTDDLLALEADVDADGRLDSAFRAIHTLKGSVAIFDFAPMGVALHAAEDLLETVRSGELAMSATIAQSLLACLDQCESWMDAVGDTGQLPLEAPREAMRIATGLLSVAGGEKAQPAVAAGASAEWASALLQRHAEALAQHAGRELVVVRYTPPEDCFFTGDDPMGFVSAVPELLALDIDPIEPWAALDEFDPYRCNLRIELVSAAGEGDVRRLFRFIPDQVEVHTIVSARGGDATKGAAAGTGANRTIRVDATDIDRLLDLVGELVVTKNSLAHLAGQVEAGSDPRTIAAAIRATQATADRVVSDMHRAVMNVRMVPLDRLFGRLSRMVRELSQRLDRRVAFDVRGETTRVDKAVADALFEPLLHLIRNAIDHGIEPPEVRQDSGKDPEGHLSLSARTLGDQILIEIRDDGAGIDAASVRRVAADRKIRTVEQVEAMDDEAAMNLIFAPGFSTVTAITDVSGRGVGMDAVKTVIAQLGGRITLASEKGMGTAVSLRLPAKAALTTVLIVQVGGERFAVPLDMVRETIRIPRASIRPLGLGQAFVLRDSTLPLIELSALLDMAPSSPEGDVKILVVGGGQGRVGIAVEEFSERLVVMLRPMAGLLAHVPGVSGTTLLGDGSVLLILNLSELIG